MRTAGQPEGSGLELIARELCESYGPWAERYPKLAYFMYYTEHTAIGSLIIGMCVGAAAAIEFNENMWDVASSAASYWFLTLEGAELTDYLLNWAERACGMSRRVLAGVIEAAMYAPEQLFKRMP